MESYKEMENMTRETLENIMDDGFGQYPVLLDYLEAAGFERCYHLAFFARKRRTRKKNLKRLLKSMEDEE